MWFGVYDTDTDSDYEPFTDEKSAREYATRQIAWMSQYVARDCIDAEVPGFARSFVVFVDDLPTTEEEWDGWTLWDHIAKTSPEPFYEWDSEDREPSTDRRFFYFADAFRRMLQADRDKGMYDGHVVYSWADLHDVVDANTYIIDALDMTCDGWTFDDEYLWDAVNDIVHMITHEVFIDQ